MRATCCRLRELARDDRGASLMELIVGMAVMSVFMTIFTAGMITLTHATTQVEAVSSSAAQANAAFLQLDKLVRYANSVTTPGQGATSRDWYVELDDADPADASERCVQLRVDAVGQQLQQRTWSVTKPQPGLTPWRPLASNVLNGNAPSGDEDQPFALPRAVAASSSLQQLTITVVTGTSGPASASTTRTSLTFSALNSNSANPDNATQCSHVPGSEADRP